MSFLIVSFSSKKRSFRVKIAATIGSAAVGITILVAIILGIRKRERTTQDRETITQFRCPTDENGTGNHTSANDYLHIQQPPSSPFLVSRSQRQAACQRLRQHIPTISSNASPPQQQQQHSPEIPHPQSTEEDALLIRQLYGHVPTEEIVRIVDGLRAERERQSKNLSLVGATLETSRQLRSGGTTERGAGCVGECRSGFIHESRAGYAASEYESGCPAV
jgi:hypothetical protein